MCFVNFNLFSMYLSSDELYKKWAEIAPAATLIFKEMLENIAQRFSNIRRHGECSLSALFLGVDIPETTLLPGAST